MAVSPQSKQINRAQIVDDNFVAAVQNMRASQSGRGSHNITAHLSAEDLLSLLQSQIASRQMDLTARVKRLENKVFYTIGSSGHEGNAMLGRLTRHTDPAFLHYRSGGFMAERCNKLEETDFIRDTALSFAASAEDPASGGRHKVWGSQPLWVLPQTSTIASHLPKAVGTALAIAQGKRLKTELPVPDDSIVVCNFGDASANHSTAQGAINTAQWAAHQCLPIPILFVCEDNGIGISVKTPGNWIESRFSGQTGLHYMQADGLDVMSGYDAVAEAINHCRQEREPVFLHMKTTRLMGHAGTDFEVDYRKLSELEHAESLDPLIRTAAAVIGQGLLSPEQVVEQYEGLRQQTLDAVDWADTRPKLTSTEEVTWPLEIYSEDQVMIESLRTDYHEQRLAVFGDEKRLPENRGNKHLAVQINQALHDLMAKYPELLIFGEDVAQKGGVYTVTKNLLKHFGNSRVFNTLLDEQTILGLAQGYGYMGMLPMPEIQYLAYFHNACDQIRGEACSMQFFSNDQFSNPMVMRIASLGYQKGFGGHFHNDNSIAALRDIPGLVVACPSRGDDAVGMLRTLTAMAIVDGRVCAFLEPIALYMTKDLYEAGDNEWQYPFPEPGHAIEYGSPRIYNHQAQDLLIITYGNGVPMSLRAAKEIERLSGQKVRVMDLRWLQPLNEEAIATQAAQCQRVLVVDEGRRTAGVGEGVITVLTEQLGHAVSVRRVVGEDSYTPLAGAATFVLPDEEEIINTGLDFLSRD